ncbi:MAG: co-chaperone DjlA [Gammaproteobacteria bacterium]|nr:co-chaperone DjlA [Gammaproteobacteria bacterium]
MSWWGKIIGGTFGFMLGGPLGALLGASLGHNFDKRLSGVPGTGEYGRGQKERVQTAFFAATFSVMGSLCKADGRVSDDEIAVARQVMAQMSLSSQQRQAAMALFNEGKKAGFPMDDVLLQLKQEIGYQPNLQRMFIEIQLYSAYADGVMHPSERALLLKICKTFGFSSHDLASLEEAIRGEWHHQQSAKGPALALNDAYVILNVAARAADAEVKRAYRRLMNQHHPDKLVSKGLPEEMMKIAENKTHEIRQAYERIKEERGF